MTTAAVLIATILHRLQDGSPSWFGAAADASDRATRMARISASPERIPAQSLP